MHAIPFDVCLRCRETRVVPAFSTTPVEPRCACVGPDASASGASGVDFEQAVSDAYAAFDAECAGEDPRQTLLRMQHFASSAAVAMLEGNTKLYVSCLVSNAALSRLLTARALTPDETDDADADEHVAGAPARDS